MSTVESHNGVYKGELADGEKHGRGTFQWTGGNGVRYDDNAAGSHVARRYEGEYVRGRKHGHGILFSGGARYDGQWRDGKPCGPGTYTWPTGNRNTTSISDRPDGYRSKIPDTHWHSGADGRFSSTSSWSWHPLGCTKRADDDVCDNDERILQRLRNNDATLTILDLHRNYLGADMAVRMAEALSLNTILTELNLDTANVTMPGVCKMTTALRHMHITDDGVTKIADALRRNRTITKLNMARNRIGAAGAERLGEALKVNNSLKALDLTGNAIGEHGARKIAAGLLVNSSLSILNLGGTADRDPDSNDGAKVHARMDLAKLAHALSHNQTLTSLHVQHNQIDAIGAGHLASALQSNNVLLTLNLDHNNIGDRASDILKNSPSLTTLSLVDNNITTGGATHLSSALKAHVNVQALNIAHNQLQPEGATKIAEALTENRSLTEINLRSIGIGSGGLTTDDAEGDLDLDVFRTLAQALRVHPTLTSIDLGDNDMRNARQTTVLEMIEAMVGNSRLSQVNLDGNNSPALNEIAHKLLDNVSLTSLNLDKNEGLCLPDFSQTRRQMLLDDDVVHSHSFCSHCHRHHDTEVADVTKLYQDGLYIGVDGLASIADAMKSNSNLTRLSLDSNDVGAHGGTKLANALSLNNTVTELDLPRNRIGAAGCSALAVSLARNRAILRLNLCGNYVCNEGARKMADALRENKVMTELNLDMNQIGDEGASALSEALHINCTLRTLGLSHNEIYDAGATVLAETLTPCSSLIDVDISDLEDLGACRQTKVKARELKANTALTALNLAANNIGSTGGIMIAEMLRKNHSLLELDLNLSSVGARGATTLAEALAENRTLTALHLLLNNIGPEGAVKIAAALRENTTLCELTVNGKNRRSRRGY